MTEMKLKFVNIEKFEDMWLETDVDKQFEGYDMLVLNGIAYKRSGGDDWRKLTFETYILSQSCDTGNAFIFNTTNNTFAIVDPSSTKEHGYFYDIAYKNNVAIKDAYDKAVLRGTYKNLNKNKASGMVITL